MEKTLDISGALKKNNPQLYRRLPRLFLSFIVKLIKEKELNQIIYDGRHLKAVDFSRHVLKYFAITLSLEGTENLTRHQPYIFVVNHPLGAIDGLGLLVLLNDLGFETKMVVNDLLNQVYPLRDRLISLNLYGKLNKRQVLDLKKALETKVPILIFPAGRTSKMEGWTIKDGDWSPFFVKKAQQFKREIVPIYFKGRNSGFFYFTAWLRKFLGMKLNLEMLLLPRQMFFHRGRHFQAVCGEPFAPSDFAKLSFSLANQKSAASKLANWVRDEKVYALKKLLQ